MDGSFPRDAPSRFPANKNTFGVWSSHDGYKSLSIDDLLCGQPQTIWGTGGRLSHHFEHHAIPWKTTMLMKNHPFWRNSHLVNILGLISIFIYEIPINHPLLYTTIFFSKNHHIFSQKKQKMVVFLPKKHLKKKSPHFWWKNPSLGFPEQGFAVRGICHTSRASCLAMNKSLVKIFVPVSWVIPWVMTISYVSIHIYIYILFIYLSIYLSIYVIEYKYIVLYNRLHPWDALQFFSNAEKHAENSVSRMVS